MDAPKKRKKNRLQRCKRFNAALYPVVFDLKKVVPGRFMILFVGPKSELPHAQLGVVTSRKALKTAVERNRARRLMREAFRTQQRKLKPGARVLLLARKNIAEEGSLREVSADLKALCDRARVWVKPPPPPPPKPKKKPPTAKKIQKQTWAKRFGRYKPPQFDQPAPRDFFNPLY